MNNGFQPVWTSPVAEAAVSSVGDCFDAFLRDECEALVKSCADITADGRNGSAT